MKKLVFLAALILLSGLTFGQGLQKGNLVGTHSGSTTLQPGVTMEKFVEFYITRVIPEYDKNYPGSKAYLLKGLRGESKDGYMLIFVFKSEKDRDKYYNKDGSSTDLGKSADAKLKPVLDELNKLGTITSTYTDWVVL